MMIYIEILPFMMIKIMACVLPFVHQPNVRSSLKDEIPGESQEYRFGLALVAWLMVCLEIL